MSTKCYTYLSAEDREALSLTHVHSLRTVASMMVSAVIATV
jgi:hypothetical protein